MRGRALLDHIVLDYCVAAVRQVNAVACSAVQVINTRICNGCIKSATLDLMTFARIVKITVVDCQISDLINIKIMSLAVTSAVIGKLAVVNRESAGWRWCAEQAILVVMEIAIVESKIAAFIANSGSVAIGYLCTRELKVVDYDVTTGNKDCLAVRNQAGRNQLDH